MIMKGHWDGIYSSKEEKTLGWYEEKPDISLDLINSLDLQASDLIIDVGCGLSYLVDNLISKGYNNFILTDISQIALDKQRTKIEKLYPEIEVNYIQDDLGDPKKINLQSGIKLWHDRAVLHFLRDEKAIENYFRTMTKVVESNGYAIIAEFAADGAKKCSGLDVERYSIEALTERLANDFSLLRNQNYTYFNPSGDERPYIYTLWQKK